MFPLEKRLAVVKNLTDATEKALARHMRGLPKDDLLKDQRRTETSEDELLIQLENEIVRVENLQDQMMFAPENHRLIQRDLRSLMLII